MSGDVQRLLSLARPLVIINNKTWSRQIGRRVSTNVPPLVGAPLPHCCGKPKNYRKRQVLQGTTRRYSQRSVRADRAPALRSPTLRDGPLESPNWHSGLQ